MATRALNVLLTGDSKQLKAAFDSAVVSATKAQAGLAASGASIERTGKKISGVGKTLNRNVTLPIAALGAVSIKAAVDFEASMRNVNSIAGLSEKKFASLSKEVKGLAGETAQSPQTLAEGLYDLVSSGFEADEAMTVLKASAKGASAGLTTTEVSAKAVAATLNAYHRPAKEAGKVTDDLFETVNRGVVSFEELASSIGYVLPTAATMGINLKEVGAAISTLTKEGQSGETAITNINQAVTAFIKPSKGMKSALKALGVETSEQLIKQKGFQGALEAVAGTTKGTKEELGKMFGNVRAQRAVFGLLGKNVKTAHEDLSAFNDDAGRTNQVLSEQKKSTAYQWRQLKAEAQDLAITFGEDLVPVLKQIVGDVKGVVQGFTNLPEGTQKAIVEFGLVAAAAGPVVRTVGALTTGVGALVKVTGGLVGAGRTVAEFGSTFGLAMKAGNGFLSSFSIAGESAAPTLMKGLTKGLPVAAAAAGLGSIIYSATQGDWKDAGFKAGGALAGGIAGAFVGGPFGAMLGAGIGSGLGGLLGGLFDSEKKLSPLQQKLAAQSDHAADAFKRQREAAHGLASAQDAVHAANRRAKQSTEAVADAHKKLNSAVKKFGPDSQQAHEAEIKLAKAQHRDATTAEEAKKAHQLSGNELRLYRHQTVEAVASEKQRLPNLEAIVRHLQKRSSREKDNIPLLERTVQKEEQLAKVNHRVNTLISEAAQTAGPKFARMLRNMTTEQAEFGTHYKGLLKLVPEFSKKTETTTQKAEHAFGHWTDVFSKQTGRAKSDVRNWSRVTNASGESVVRKLNESLSALGVKEIMWGGAKKQRGGPINLGAPTGDSVPALLERGEYVLNRNAVNSIGTSTLDAINFNMAPRHQTGGPIGPEPRLTGTDPLRTGGQHAIHQVYDASKKYYNRHSGKARVIANGNRMDALGRPYLWGGGHGPTASVNGPWDCSGGISELFDGAGWNFAPMVSSGFESWGLPGKGEISVLANADHVYAVVEGKGAIGTSGENPGGGFGWISGYTFRPGFTIRHADFSEQAMQRRTSGNKGRGQKAKKGFQKGGGVHLYGPPLFRGEGPPFYAAALRHNQPWATHQSPWVTKLSPSQEAQFRVWGRNIDGRGHGFGWFGFNPDRRRNDYDMRGFWKETGGQGPAANGHFTDKWKTPYDTTFSNESKYATRGTPYVWTPNYKWLYDRRTGREIIAGRFQKGGLVVTGKASYEGGTGNGTSDGQHTDEDPGFAIRDTKTLGDWFWVKVGGAEGLLQHTDWGPAEWTGRAIDFTAAGLRKIGAPLSITDTTATVEWAGHTVAGAMKNLGRDGKGGKGTKKKHVKPHLGNARAVEVPGLRPSRLLPSAKGLEQPIRNALRAPGLHYSGKVSIGETALARAEETVGTEDDLAVLDFQEELFGKNKKRLQKKLKQLDSRLKTRQSPQERRKTLAQRQHVEEELGTTSGNLAGARSSRKELNAQAREEQEERQQREKEEREEREQREREEPRKRADLALARAEESKNTKSDDIAALQELKKVAEDELHYAESTGNLEDIANATRNLTQATENLNQVAVEAFEEKAEGELALAELTESLADDLAVLHSRLTFAEEQLAKSEQEGNWAEIAKWAHEVKGLTDAIKADEGAESSAQLAEEVKALREEMQKNREIAESVQGTSAAAAWRALADQFAGYLGPKTMQQTALPGTGSVGGF